MEIVTTNPTNLNIYYCEDCYGIVATTDLTSLLKTSIDKCPFCSQDNFIMLPKEDYQPDFNLDLFPFPQNIFLEKFFQYADNTIELLTAFSEIGALSVLPEQLAQIPQLNNLHILINPDLLITVNIEISEDDFIRISAKTPANISSLLG
ncbi:MAG: hypothetical protein QNJ33_12310 [Crocosphaera sp.]|nr:hypothetical protein [Crocosphaera sp.]